MATVNPNASHIWDETEVYLIPPSAVVGDIEDLVPASVNDELDAIIDDHFLGLIDASTGVGVAPEIEITHYDGFGHSRYRSKAKKGAVTTTVNAYEENDVTRSLSLAGSTSGKWGAPRSQYRHAVYVSRDETPDGTWVRILITIKPALIENSAHGGMVEGEQEAREFTVHHANDPNGDVFFVVEGFEGVGAATRNWTATVTGTPTGGTFTLTYKGKTTAGIAYNAAPSAVKSALVALDDGYDASDWTVGGSAGAYTIAAPTEGVLTANGASLTGGTTPGVTVAAA
ncbi:hypothetical protein GYA93_15800 [Gordonia desulfuricans]|uniref:Uncharacterized protein n=1 Tax=Gordonia desulfuricans TaxID=89051 RepID=A0A7K3LSE9_9ACTN|nr:hypothetical protein [Gordonia desulfuricans]NDK91036.1 hypothetical protein [Gordonia desulfuricans]